MRRKERERTAPVRGSRGGGGHPHMHEEHRVIQEEKAAFWGPGR